MYSNRVYPVIYGSRVWDVKLVMERIEGLPEQSAPTDYPAERAWLDAYPGTFELFVSLRSQLKARGYLSEKQWACITRALEREKPKAAPEPQTSIDYAPGMAFRLSRWIGNEVAEAAGLTRPHFLIEVVEYMRETAGAVMLKVRLSAQRTDWCSVCGAKLRNPVSVTNGIGPICGERAGIVYSSESLQALRESLMTTQEVTRWFPKTSLKKVEV